ncbi:MAG TPA: metal-sulfur cluster assembly factor [Chloroflexota bacterium]|nr:metal-sulfur cluster assembly factor [Chloroflexota bacterium]
MATFLLTEERVRHALQQVIDPELGVNVVDLGLIYGIAIEGATVTVTMTLTTPGCPLHESLAEAVEEAIRLFVPGVEAVRVQLVWEPPWTPERISPAGRAELGWE